MLRLKPIVFFRRDSNLKSILLDCWRLFYFEHCLMNLKFRSKSKNILNTSKHCQERSLEILLYTISFTKKCTRWKNLTFLGGVNWQTPVTVIKVEVHSMTEYITTKAFWPKIAFSTPPWILNNWKAVPYSIWQI